MAVWGIVSIIVLFIIFAVFIGLNVMTTSNNKKIAQRQQFMPFGSVIDPTTGAPTHPTNGTAETPFTTNDENGNLIPQIRCPVGTKINILGAFFDIFDPYNECSTSVDQVNPYFGFLCVPGFSGKNQDGTAVAACNDDSDCVKYGARGQYGCGTNGTCVLKPLSSGQQCPVWNGPNGKVQLKSIAGSDGKSYCVDPNMCGSNITLAKGATGVPNPYCNPKTGAARCAMRDASATVAAKCNGRRTCENLTVADFGEYPCAGVAPVQCIIGTNGDGSPKWYTPTGQSGDGTVRQPGYCSLPFIQGYKGGLPEYGTTSPDPANYNHGYTMHGLYSCVTE